MAYSEAAKRVIAAEVLDPNKVALVCGIHNYTPIGSNGMPIPPATQGCKNCWQAYFTASLAQTPPHLREQRLGEWEKTIKDAVQYIESGKEWDFVPYTRPHIEVEKG